MPLIELVAPSGLKYKAWQTPSPQALDAYELAQKRQISVTEAVAVMSSEGWTFDGYNDDGMEVYLPPSEM